MESIEADSLNNFNYEKLKDFDYFIVNLRSNVWNVMHRASMKYMSAYAHLVRVKTLKELLLLPSEARLPYLESIKTKRK